MPSPTHQILQKAGRLGTLVILTHRPLIRQAVRLGWKTARSECQTGREHAEFEGTRVEIPWKGCVSASEEDGEGDGRTDVQHK